MHNNKTVKHNEHIPVCLTNLVTDNVKQILVVAYVKFVYNFTKNEGVWPTFTSNSQSEKCY